MFKLIHFCILNKSTTVLFTGKDASSVNTGCSKQEMTDEYCNLRPELSILSHDEEFVVRVKALRQNPSSVSLKTRGSCLSHFVRTYIDIKQIFIICQRMNPNVLFDLGNFRMRTKHQLSKADSFKLFTVLYNTHTRLSAHLNKFIFIFFTQKSPLSQVCMQLVWSDIRVQ